MLENLIALERAADEEIDSTAVMELPARAVLAGLHLLTFYGRFGHLLGGAIDQAQGDAIVTRLGHALPLLGKLAAAPFGASAEDAMGAFQDELERDNALVALLNYLHFSEIMPEARRGRLVVELDGDNLRLNHPNEEFERAEALDITLSELAIPFVLHPNAGINPIFRDLARTAPQIDWPTASRFIAENAYKFRHGVAESDLITEVSINHIFGFNRDRFLFIRSAVMAFAEFCETLALAIHVQIEAGQLNPVQGSEGLEWLSVNLAADFVHDFIAAASQSTAEEVERFLEIYTIDYRHEPARHWGGDGFFPPLARFEQGYLFSPSLVLMFLQVRNAVYAFAKKDRDAFNNDVSHELEPVLLRHAGELLRRGGDWIIVEDVSFPGGQIDLLIAAPGDDAVLLVQAKGTLPPQGARLTERLTDRVREGVLQIERFVALGEPEQAAAVERALGRPVANLVAHHALLTRSCFGAPEVLAADFPYVRMTIPVLSLALEHHREAGLPTTIAGLVEAIAETFARVVAETEPHWERGEIEVAGTVINLPLLNWRPGAVDALRREWWEAAIRPVADNP